MCSYREGRAPALAVLVGIAAAFVLVGAMLAGCGASAAQRLASAQATVHVAHQSARVEFYSTQDRACLASSSSLAEWERCMLPAVAVARTADTYRDALMSAQAMIDAVGAEAAQAAIACAVVAAREFASSLDAAGAPIPQEVRDVAAITVGVTCGE